MTRARSQHRIPFVDSIIDDEEIIVFRKLMLCNNVHLSSLWRRAYLIAAFNETSVLQEQ